MLFPISEIGKEMLKMQADLAEEYSYKKQPDIIGELNMLTYYQNLPLEMSGEKRYVDGMGVGYQVDGKDIPLYSKDGTKIASKYDRIVIGHYGAFLEISPEDMELDNVICKKGQEYRISNPEYVDKVKYQWFTTKDDSNCKLYFQQKCVTYADYQPDKWYISPYEICDAKERETLLSKQDCK